jgi:hypothetical protein
MSKQIPYIIRMAASTAQPHSLLDSLLHSGFSLPKAVATLNLSAQGLLDAADHSHTHLGALSSLFRHLSELRTLHLHTSALDDLVRVCKESTNLVHVRLAATAILRYDPTALRRRSTAPELPNPPRPQPPRSSATTSAPPQPARQPAQTSVRPAPDAAPAASMSNCAAHPASPVVEPQPPALRIPARTSTTAAASHLTAAAGAAPIHTPALLSVPGQSHQPVRAPPR